MSMSKYASKEDMFKQLLEEECADGDRILALFPHLQRTEGGRLPVAKLVNAISDLAARCKVAEASQSEAVQQDTARLDLIEKTCVYPWKDFGCWKFRIGKTTFSGATAREAIDAAIAEPFVDERCGNPGGGGQYATEAFKLLGPQRGLAKGEWNVDGSRTSRNKRTVWTVSSKPLNDAHFATFPPDLIEPCILAGCPEGGTVLDPFGGAGTTGLVADRHKRNAILIELNPEYVEMARKRIFNDAPLFADVA